MATMSNLAIEVRDRRTTDGDCRAGRGIDLHLRRGKISGLLGLNGTGTTTPGEILEGYRDRCGGEGPAARGVCPRRWEGLTV